MRHVLATLVFSILVSTAAAREPTITLSVKDTPLRKVVKEIEKQSKIAVVAGPTRVEMKITLSLDAVPLTQALKRVAGAANATAVRLTSKAAWIGRNLEVWEKRLHASLILGRVGASFEDEFLGKALQKAAEDASVPVVLDPEVTRTRERFDLKVTLRVSKLRSRDLFTLLSAPFALTWDVRYGGVFVSTSKRLKDLPRHGLTPPPAGRMGAEEAKFRRRLAVETVYTGREDSRDPHPVIGCDQPNRLLAVSHFRTRGA